ncbi:hypothetical protein [Paraburkholderia sp.]|jgi:hypothetical protein|uniref:hypothetical protein n=1 Tax=Paraburkholderia sp. TaxID=1926495 RepID=UPI002F3E5728
MVQMILSMSGTGRAQGALQMHGNVLARKMLGLAIVSSGYAVLLAHGLQHMFGG